MSSRITNYVSNQAGIIKDFFTGKARLRDYVATGIITLTGLGWGYVEGRKQQEQTMNYLDSFSLEQNEGEYTLTIDFTTLQPTRTPTNKTLEKRTHNEGPLLEDLEPTNNKLIKND